MCARVQLNELGIPSFMNNTLEDLHIGTYRDIATVRIRPLFNLTKANYYHY